MPLESAIRIRLERGSIVVLDEEPSAWAKRYFPAFGGEVVMWKIFTYEKGIPPARRRCQTALGNLREDLRSRIYAMSCTFTRITLLIVQLSGDSRMLAAKMLQRCSTELHASDGE